MAREQLFPTLHVAAEIVRVFCPQGVVLSARRVPAAGEVLVTGVDADEEYIFWENPLGIIR